mmetsp:Transcript_12857/g.17301  ORF Transcript_12857/g.17301 Transcript_12857/m.17301 type:complete len:80 (-) Transcript_12857:51-290(-)
MLLREAIAGHDIGRLVDPLGQRALRPDIPTVLVEVICLILHGLSLLDGRFQIDLRMGVDFLRRLTLKYTTRLVLVQAVG